jgi:hypothetical protein
MSTRVCVFFSCAETDLKAIPGTHLVTAGTGPALRLDGFSTLADEFLLFVADAKADPPVYMALPHGDEWTKGCTLTDLLTKARLSGVKLQGPWSPKQAAALGYAVPCIMAGDRLAVVEKIAYEPTDADVRASKAPDRAKVFAAVAVDEPLKEEPAEIDEEKP